MTLPVEDTDRRDECRSIETATSIGWVVVLVVSLVMVARTSTVAYSADSWSYVDIARSIFEPDRSLGEILGTRDYVNEPWRNDSLPFLWPAALVPGIAIWGAASPVGAVMFVLIWLCTSAVMVLTARHLRLPSFVGPALALSLLAIPGYVSEGHGGRSIPLNGLLIATSLLLLLRNRAGPWTALLVGFLSGLCAANRFDALLHGPIVILLALVFGYFAWTGALAAACGWAVGPLLWVVYSHAYLGGFYVADNNRVALSPVPTFVNDWPAAVPPGDASPRALLDKALGNLDVLAESLVGSYRWWGYAALVGLMIGIGLVLLRRWLVADSTLPSSSGNPAVEARRWAGFVALLTLALLALQAAYMLMTGYGEERYWAVVGLLLLELVVALTAAKRHVTGPARGINTNAPLVGLLSLTVTLGVLGILEMGREFRQVGEQGTSDAQLAACMQQVQGVAMVAGVEAFRIPATTGLRAAFPPNNAAVMTREDWADLAAQYGVTAWINPGDDPRYAIPVNATGILAEVVCTKT